MPEWLETTMHAALSLGVGGGGLAMLLRAGMEVWRMRERGALHRESAGEATAVTVQRAMDEMRGRLARVEGDNRKLTDERDTCRAEVDELRKALRAMRLELDDIYRMIDTARRASVMPPLMRPTSEPPQVSDESVERSERDKR